MEEKILNEVEEVEVNSEELVGDAMTDEELMSLLESLKPEKQDLNFAFEPIEFDDEMIFKMSSTEEAIKGAELGAKYGMMYTTLINMSVPIESAETLVVNEQTMDLNIKLQKVVNEGSVATTKAQTVVSKNSML